MLLDFSRTTLGTANVNGTRCIEYIQRGLTAGYRSIDTAQAYRNEEAVGQAIREHSVPRKQIHVMTKVSTGFKQNPGSLNEVKDAVEGSLTRLKIGYVDAMLIHHPGDDTVDPEAAYRRRVTWQGLETLVELGKVRNIGVSNFNIAHLRELKQYARILPVVNQIEVIISALSRFLKTNTLPISYIHGVNSENWSIIARKKRFHFKHISQFPEILKKAMKG